MVDIEFSKMHGLGNDFVIFDGRHGKLPISSQHVRAISDRRTGIGCDQVIIIELPKSSTADVFMRIYNADGGEVFACGNATRCIAAKLMQEDNTDRVAIETRAGSLTAKKSDHGVCVNMGEVRYGWNEIPLKKNMDTLHVNISEGELFDPVCINIGNPHTVFFVSELQNIPLADLGPRVENNPLFPEKTNVEAVQVIERDYLQVRVWERGVGQTRACGTGACAALVAGFRRGLTNRQAKVELEGGILDIHWLDNGQVLMTGPTATSFRGSWKL